MLLNLKVLRPVIFVFWGLNRLPTDHLKNDSTTDSGVISFVLGDTKTFLVENGFDGHFRLLNWYQCGSTF